MRPIRRRSVAVCALLTILSACSRDATGPGVGERLRLSEARRRWSAHQHGDYLYTVTRSCFCTTESIQPMRVRVHDGAVVSATYVDGGQPVSEQLLAYVPSVEGLFAIVDDATAHADRLTVSYDPTLGYPRSVAIDWYVNAADDEVWYGASDVTPVR